jgi:hypothetical protein
VISGETPAFTGVVAVHSAGALLGGARVRRVLSLATALLLLGLGLRMVFRL